MDWMMQGLNPCRSKRLLHNVQTNSGAHPAFYSLGIGGSFAGCKVAGP
jgi:hypothetical protein